MAAATVESSIQMSISSSPLKMTSKQSESGSPEAANVRTEEPHQQRESSETAQPEQEPQTDSRTGQAAADRSAEEPATDKSSQETADNTQPDGGSQRSVTQVGGGSGADSDSDAEPVMRSRPRARRLALDSDSEGEDNPADVAAARGRALASDEEEEDARAPEVDDYEAEDKSRKERNLQRLMALGDSSSEDETPRPQSPTTDDDNEEQLGATKSGGMKKQQKKKVGKLKAEKKAAKQKGKIDKGATAPESDDSEAEDKSRKERNLQRLMALGDSPSEDETSRPQSPTMNAEDEDQLEGTKSGGKKKKQKKLGRKKLEQQAAEQMLEIRSCAQRRTRETRLNLPYHRPKQRTLHEFLARRQRAPALPEHPRVSAADAYTITRRQEETEKEIAEFYRSASEHEDGAGSDPEWAPEGAATAQATKPQSPVAGPSTAADATDAAANATATAAPGAEEAKDDEEDDKVMSQSSQKVQEWLEGVQPGGDGATDPPMTDVGQTEPAAAAAATVTDTVMATETEVVMETEAVTEATVTEAGPAVKTLTAEKDESEPAPAAVDERPAEEARSVSADTETTSLAPGDSASEVNARASTSAAPAPAAAAAAPAPPAARLARLAARLPQLGAVLSATPRLQKRSDVVMLDDSDEETAAPEQSELDKFVERFVRHSNAKPKKTEKKTVNISVVRYESDAAGGQQLVADSVPVTVTSGDPAEPAAGPPGAGRQELHNTLLGSIRRQREQARQRREREYKLYNCEDVEDGYLDDLPDEEAEPSDVSSESGESEPEEEPPLTETPRAARCALLDDEAEQEDEQEDGEDAAGDTEEFKLVLEDDEEDLLGDSPRRASVATEPELFSTQPSGTHANVETADSQDSDRASSSLVTAHQPGGGFRFGGDRRHAADEPAAAEEEEEDLPLTPVPDTQPLTPVLDTQPVCGTGSFSLPPEDTQEMLAATGPGQDMSDSFSGQLGPLLLTPEQRARGPRSAIGALLDPAADESMDDLLSLCSGKFDAPGTSKPRVTRADTQPVDLLSMPLPTNKDGVMTWSAAPASQKAQRNPSSEPLPGMSLLSTVDMFEDGNANMPLEIVSDDDDGRCNTPPSRQKKRRRRLVFSDDEGSDNGQQADEDGSNSEDEDGVEDSGEDSVQAARVVEDTSLPTDFTGFLGGNKKKPMRSEFFDGEAELSGSDEPSEDEEDGDELDRMEEEAADAEQIDEHKLREQVERIHQKKALDDDIREMKLFQERFLEDGDLHGRGRERKFRWSNADEAEDESNERRASEDEADPAEDERDETWRLQRHERDKWLQENAQKGDDADEPETSGFTFLKPGQKVLRRLVSGGQRSSEAAAPAAAAAAPAPARADTLPPTLPVSPRAVKVRSRGSFLSRGKEALARLVTTARSLSTPAGTSSKNSNKRTFTVAKRQQTETEPDPEVELEFQKTVEEKTTKRKAPSALAKDAKRAKISRSFSSLAEDSQSSSLFSVIL